MPSVGIVQKVKSARLGICAQSRGGAQNLKAVSAPSAGNLGRPSVASGKRQDLAQVLDLARLAGFEPTTPAFGGRYSIQLSYRRVLIEVFALRETVSE